MNDLEKKVNELRKHIQAMREQLGNSNWDLGITVGELMIREGMLTPLAPPAKVPLDKLKAKLGALKK